MSPPAAPPSTTVGVSGREVPTRCSKGTFLALFLGLEFISEDAIGRLIGSRYFGQICFSNKLVQSVCFAFIFLCLFFLKQKEKKSLNPPFPSTAGGECVGVLWNIIDIHPASAPASRFAIPTPSPLSIPCSPPQKGTLCHHHYGSVKMPKFSMTYPILRPRSVWTTFMQGYKWEGGGEGVASGEGGVVLGEGGAGEWRSFLSFFKKKKNKFVI